ncbi:MAG: hypothetical protein ABJ314_09635 [Ilumatobacter sp.]|uniref:hypothetical protein n=1 Tax=Ilumatobacter sp. TaxID=1967498 RepID=UPI00329A4F05
METTSPSPSSNTVATARRSDRGHLWRSRWAAIGAAAAVTIGAGGFIGLANAASSVPSDIVSITPVRVLDTRAAANLGLSGPFVSATGQDLKVTGVIPTAGGAQQVVPDGATSVLLNVTSVGSTAGGFISVRPADAPGAPSTSNLNFTAGSTTPNAVTVQIPTAGPDAGKIEITYSAQGVAGPTTEVLVDVVGYTTAAPTPPPRALFAVVDQNGSVSRSTPGAVTSSELLAGVPDGRYAVTFDRDISACAYQATVGRPGVNVGPQSGIALVANWTESPTDSVIVFVKDLAGAGVERGFHLTVTC